MKGNIFFFSKPVSGKTFLGQANTKKPRWKSTGVYNALKENRF